MILYYDPSFTHNNPKIKETFESLEAKHKNQKAYAETKSIEIVTLNENSSMLPSDVLPVVGTVFDGVPAFLLFHNISSSTIQDYMSIRSRPSSNTNTLTF